MAALVSYSGSESDDDGGLSYQPTTAVNDNSYHDDCIKGKETSTVSTYGINPTATLHRNEEASVIPAADDFFSLAEHTNVLEVENIPDPQLLFDSERQSSVSNECNIDFWNTDIPSEDWTHPEKIWGVPSDLTESKLISTRDGNETYVSGRSNKKIKGYSSKRYQSYISSESLVFSGSSVSPKRSCLMVHHKIAPYVHTTTNVTNRIPRKLFRILPGHSGTVNRIHWNVSEYSHLLLTASMDATVRVWNAFASSDLDPCIRTLKVHSKAVKAARWSACGRQIVSCSYDKCAKLSDVESGNRAVLCFVVYYA